MILVQNKSLLRCFILTFARFCVLLFVSKSVSLLGPLFLIQFLCTGFTAVLMIFCVYCFMEGSRDVDISQCRCF